MAGASFKALQASDFGDAAIDRTNRHALRIVKMAFTVVALGGVDDIDTFFDANGDVRALRLASIARGAGFGVDFVGHGDTPIKVNKVDKIKKNTQAASATPSARWV
jgi:hypothetical protein